MFHQQFIIEESDVFFGSKISMSENQEVEQELKAMGETFHRRDARVRAMFETLASSQADEMSETKLRSVFFQAIDLKTSKNASGGHNEACFPCVASGAFEHVRNAGMLFGGSLLVTTCAGQDKDFISVLKEADIETANQVAELQLFCAPKSNSSVWEF